MKKKVKDEAVSMEEYVKAHELRLLADVQQSDKMKQAVIMAGYIENLIYISKEDDNKIAQLMDG